MADPLLSLGPVSELVELLRESGHRVEVDPGKLTPPGVLVTVSSFAVYTLSGAYVPTVMVRAVVPDGGVEQSGDELVSIVNDLLELIEPDGPITPMGLIMPNDPAPLPCLSFPVNLS